MRKILATILAVCTVLSMLVAVPITATADSTAPATVGYVAPKTVITTDEAEKAGYTDLATHGANALVDGSEYYIKDATGLSTLSVLVNSKKNTAGSKIYVTADIDLGGTHITPIGYFNGAGFAGYFNGQGHTISGIGSATWSVGKTNICYYGLFGLVSGTVENVVLSNSCKFYAAGGADATSGLRGVGSIAGYVTGTVNNCYSEAYVNVRVTMSNNGNSATTDAQPYGCGGIVGASVGTISNCTFNGTIDNKNNGVAVNNNFFGGIAGYSTGSISGCKNIADITLVGTVNYLGGITGGNCTKSADTLTVENCVNTGALSNSGGGVDVGGICGVVRGTATIKNCTNTGNISALKQSGGLVGAAHWVGLTIENSKNYGNVTVKWTASGMVSRSAGGSLKVTDCANYGVISATGPGAASLILASVANATTVTPTNVRNYATITGSLVSYDGIVDHTNTPTHFYGYQTRTNEKDSTKVDLRFVGSIDSAEYWRAGFKITVTNKTDPSKSFEIKEDVAHVYVELLQEGGNITVPAYRGEGAFLFALVVEGIPAGDLADYTFTVETYSIATEGGAETQGDISTPNFSIVR
ncbi:MAG: hypothetical protein IKC59_04620 [Clostridia bacterium]|nr:hypothetical protein [Clostridia bacterium]